MTRRTKTMNLKGNDYAGVPDRIKEFREDCPQGKIITKHQKSDKGTIFKAYIWKNKADVHYTDTGVTLDSADATGTAESTKTGEKDFEKLETISIGRGLAILGYLASGEIASTEEMEEYYEFKDEAIQKSLADATSVEDLLAVYSLLNSSLKVHYQEQFTKRKTELEK